ncbi:MAG: JAB domain-containing protein [Pseudomonadota bacterium]|nr:JAB domain-containing protein [Pseudomonadota bacterium]
MLKFSPNRRADWIRPTAFRAIEQKETLSDRKNKEEFHVLFLDKKIHITASELMGSGTVDHAPLYPREVTNRALE